MSDVHGKARGMGQKLSACVEMLGWLYDRALDQEFMRDVDNVMSGVSLLGTDSRITVRRARSMDQSKRYAVTLEYDGKLVIQCSGEDIAWLAKGMMRVVAENMSAQAMSIFAEDAGDEQA